MNQNLLKSALLSCLLLTLFSCEKRYMEKTYASGNMREGSSIVYQNSVTFIRKDFDLLISASISRDYEELNLPALIRLTSPSGTEFRDSVNFILDSRHSLRRIRTFNSTDYEWLYRERITPFEYGDWKIDLYFDKSLKGKIKGAGISIQGGSSVPESLIKDSTGFMRDTVYREDIMQLQHSRRMNVRNSETVFIDQQAKDNLYD